VCIDCADMIHQIFTIQELRDMAGKGVLKKMLVHPKMQNWVEYIKDKELGITCIKSKKRRK